MMLAVARSERAPSVEELFSNVDQSTCGVYDDEEQLVVHAAVGLLSSEMLGSKTRRRTTLSLVIRMNSGSVTGEFSAYYNSISDYIFFSVLRVKRLKGLQSRLIGSKMPLSAGLRAS